jgi:hypothetical protein
MVFKFCRCADDFIIQKVHFLQLMPVWVGLIMLLAFLWVPSNQGPSTYILSILVPYKFKVAPYWSVIIVLSTFLQFSNVKQTQVCSAPAARQVFSTTLAAPQKEL